jgi:hypothetical protein
MSELLPPVDSLADEARGGLRPARSGRRRIASVAGAPAAVAATAIGAALGWWAVPFAAGLAIGLAYRRRGARFAVLTAGLSAAAGWAVPLLWLAARGEPVVATARVIAAIAGLPISAALMLAATVLLAFIQAALGVCLARAVSTSRAAAGRGAAAHQDAGQEPAERSYTDGHG